MEARSLEVTMISACNLKNSRSMFSTKRKAYAVAWISNDRKGRQWTPVDKYGGIDPTWNHVMNFTLNEAFLQQGHLVLEIAIYRKRIFCDKVITHGSIPLKQFLKSAGGDEGAGAGDSAQFGQVQKSPINAKTVINVSVKLAEMPQISKI